MDGHNKGTHDDGDNNYDDVVEDGWDIVGDVDDDGMRAGPDARTHLLLVTSLPSVSSSASPSTSARSASF